MGHSGIYILIHFYDSAAKYIWSIGNKINDGHKALAVLTLNNLLFDANLLLFHDATSVSATARGVSRGVKRKWQALSSWHRASQVCGACFHSRRIHALLLPRWRPEWPREWNHVRFWVMEEDILRCPSSPPPSPSAACSFARAPSILSLTDVRRWAAD